MKNRVKKDVKCAICCYKSRIREKVDTKTTTLLEQIKKLPFNSSKIVQLLITHKANRQRNDQNRPKNYLN